MREPSLVGVYVRTGYLEPLLWLGLDSCIDREIRTNVPLFPFFSCQRILLHMLISCLLFMIDFDVGLFCILFP
jgi:hypothetical protein